MKLALIIGIAAVCLVFTGFGGYLIGDKKLINDAKASAAPSSDVAKYMHSDLAGACHVLQTASNDMLIVTTKDKVTSARCVPFFANKDNAGDSCNLKSCGGNVTILENSATSSVILIFPKGNQPIIESQTMFQAPDEDVMWNMAKAIGTVDNQVACILRGSPLYTLLTKETPLKK